MYTLNALIYFTVESRDTADRPACGKMDEERGEVKVHASVASFVVRDKVKYKQLNDKPSNGRAPR